MSGERGKARISAQDWEILYRKYSPKLEGYFSARGAGPGDTEDLAQEIFAQLGQGHRPEDPSAYLYAMARNILAGHRRRRIAEHTTLNEFQHRLMTQPRRSASPDPDPGLSEEASITEVQRMLGALVTKLPPEDTQLATLRFIEGLSVRQVARRLGCSENAARKRIRKLRATLRRLYRP